MTIALAGWLTVTLLILIAAVWLGVWIMRAFDRIRRREEDRQAHQTSRNMPRIYDHYDHDLELYDPEDRKRRNDQ